MFCISMLSTHKKSALCLALALCLSPVASFAQDKASVGEKSSVTKAMAPLRYKDSTEAYFDERERGWHWYEEALEDPVEETPEPVAEKPPEEKPPEKPAKSVPAGPPPMSGEWIKENLPKYLMKAVDVPSDENVRAYLYLQRYAMDKAQNYAMASQRVTAGDAYLDANVRRPISQVGSAVADEDGLKLQVDLLKKLAKTTGIMFFFRGNCSFCHTQWPLLQMFAKAHGFTVMPISMDGSILEGMDPKTVQKDQGQSALFDVTVVPSTFLMQPPDKFAVISHGVTSAQTFQGLVIQAAVSAKLIDEKDFLLTRGVKDKSIRASLTEDATQEIVENPVLLVEYMKKKIRETK